MTVTAQDVKALRDRTGVGMMACRKALEEAGGDMDQAIELLRKRGEAKAGAKADRETSEGAVAISGRGMVQLKCETDFVARNEKYVALVQTLADATAAGDIDTMWEETRTDAMQEMGENLVLEHTTIAGGTTVGGYVHGNKKIGVLVALDGGTEDMARDVAMHAAAMDPLVANPSDVPAEAIEKEKEIYREQLIAEGKPEQILDKIIAGKVQKFCAERALSSQPFVKDPSQTVAEYLGDATLVAFIRYAV